MPKLLLSRLFAFHLVTLAAVLLLGPSAVSATAENWPQWRGPRGDGTSLETGLPLKWSKTENVAWRLPLPGPAGATPIVWGDRIFITSAKDRDLVLLCADTDGKLLWEQTVASGDKPVRGDEGNSASPSPVTDGKRVWVYMGTGDLACFDFDGKEVWKFNLQDRYGRFNIQFGMSSTPVLDGDRLYLQCLHSDAALVLALDKNSGKEIWRHDRQSDARAECEHSYASPILYRDGQRELLISHGADYIVAHRLSDGAEVWRCGGLNPKGAKYNPTLRFVASPVAAPGLIVVPSAKNGPVLGLSPDASGDISESQQGHVWTRRENTPDVPSPLVHDGLVYLCRENGVLICLDAKTGEQQYQERTHSQRHRASPVYADGKLYLTARDGVVSVVKTGRKFEILATNELGEDVSSSPVISNGTLYLRGFDALYAIREKSPEKATNTTKVSIDIASAESESVCQASANALALKDSTADKPSATSPDGYQPIFNGKDLSGWVVEGTSRRKEGDQQSPVWTVADEMIHCAGAGFGFLRYETRVCDFSLKLEYRIAKGANSGVGVRTVVYKGTARTRPSFASYEIQLLDDAGKAPDDHSTGSLYRYVAPTANASKPAGEWNAMDIDCRGPHIAITINGQKVQDVDQSTVAAIKDKPLCGYVALQNHGGMIDFRNLRLKTLDAPKGSKQ